MGQTITGLAPNLGTGSAPSLTSKTPSYSDISSDKQLSNSAPTIELLRRGCAAARLVLQKSTAFSGNETVLSLNTTIRRCRK